MYQDAAGEVQADPRPWGHQTSRLPVALRILCFKSLFEVSRPFTWSLGTALFTNTYKATNGYIRQICAFSSLCSFTSHTEPYLMGQAHPLTPDLALHSVYTRILRVHAIPQVPADWVVQPKPSYSRQSHVTRLEIFPIPFDHIFNMQKNSTALVW